MDDGDDAAPRSVVAFAAVAGVTASALTLVVAGLPSLLVSGRRALPWVLGIGVAVAIGTATLALAEERAARLVSRGRVLAGLSSLLPAALVAALLAGAHAAWTSAVQNVGPDHAPSRLLDAVTRLDATGWRSLGLACLLPTAIALPRAARPLAPGRRLALAALALTIAYGTVMLASRADPDVQLGAIAAGIVYLAGVSFADRLVKESPSLASVSLLSVCGRFAAPLLIVAALCPGLGWITLVVLAVWVVWTVGVAMTFKSLVLGAYPAEFDLVEDALPSWFDPSSLRALDSDLERHGLRRARLGLLRSGSSGGGNVVGIAVGEGKTVATILCPAPTSADVAPGAPAITLCTWLGADEPHAVISTDLVFHGLSWITARSPRVVYDARPGATVDELFARHAVDVAALSAIVGPPTGPSTVERYVERVRSDWPSLVDRLRRTPAPWLLACAWWFEARRPVRLRGPLPR